MSTPKRQILDPVPPPPPPDRRESEPPPSSEPGPPSAPSQRTSDPGRHLPTEHGLDVEIVDRSLRKGGADSAHAMFGSAAMILTDNETPFRRAS